MKRIAICIGLLTLLPACTSTGPIEKVSTRFIDRAYTLPDGVAIWKTLVVTGTLKTATNDIFIPPFPIPLLWEQAINDDLTLLWAPLPLGIKYQISKTESQLWGASFVLGAGFDSTSGFAFVPTASLTNRTKFSENMALQSTASFTYSHISNAANPNGYVAGLIINPIFQSSDTLAWGPTLGLSVSKSLYLNSGVTRKTSAQAETSLSPGLMADWKFAAQWGLEGSYQYLGAGSNELSGNIAVLALNHYW